MRLGRPSVLWSDVKIHLLTGQEEAGFKEGSRRGG